MCPPGHPDLTLPWSQFKDMSFTWKQLIVIIMRERERWMSMEMESPLNTRLREVVGQILSNVCESVKTQGATWSRHIWLRHDEVLDCIMTISGLAAYTTVCGCNVEAKIFRSYRNRWIIIYTEESYVSNTDDVRWHIWVLALLYLWYCFFPLLHTQSGSEGKEINCPPPVYM